MLSSPCSFVTGVAGSGKTYTLKQAIAADPSHALLCATTGIAAVNLDSTTINSVLGYFDTASLEEKFISGKLAQRLHSLITGKGKVRHIAIDEVSMMDARQLDLITLAMDDANHYADMDPACPAGIILTGDAAQLGPINAPWFFEAENWGRFDANTIKLERIWRQTDPAFVAALNLFRAGDGAGGAHALAAISEVEWASSLDPHFDGSTIVGRNAEVDRFNTVRLMEIRGREFFFASSRWGRSRGEWRLIPDRWRCKVEAMVMLLANAPRAPGDLGPPAYANGDLGHVVEVATDEDGNACTIRVKLLRNGGIVTVSRIVRHNGLKDHPEGKEPGDGVSPGTVRVRQSGSEWLPGEFYDEDKKQFIVGGIYYFPMRLAYASTVHKTQGLSLDRVQIDVRDAFMGSPAMVYVALSRCRSAAGLRIVGGHELLGKRTKVDPRTARWI